MTKPVPNARTIVTEDGVPIDAAHLPGDQDLAIVLAHGFMQNWQRPVVWRVATRLNKFAGIVTFDFRGHGRSGGVSTVGDKEIKDIEVAVGYARELGYQRIATVGFSMGASVVLRHGGLLGGVDAIVSVSGPGRWHYKGTRPMRLLHLAVGSKVGRLITRTALNTRVADSGWNPVPLPPAEAAALISPIPLLIVHGDQDEFFPVDHAQSIYDAARDPKELWIIPGFGHAERYTDLALLNRIGAWIRAAVGLPAIPGAAAVPVAPVPVTPEAAAVTSGPVADIRGAAGIADDATGPDPVPGDSVTHPA
jgi:pimeloyl-ACP methyl ester carboxylesterase